MKIDDQAPLGLWKKWSGVSGIRDFAEEFVTRNVNVSHLDILWLLSLAMILDILTRLLRAGNGLKADFIQDYLL